MRELNIYLAGAMMNCKTFDEMNGWRQELTQVIEEKLRLCADVSINVINPCYYYNFENDIHQSELEVMQFDLAKVKSSDIIVVNLNGLNTSIGTSIEIYEAYKQEIPVFAIDLDNEYDSVHPWLQCCITRVEKSEIDLVRYIRDFYVR